MFECSFDEALCEVEEVCFLRTSFVGQSGVKRYCNTNVGSWNGTDIGVDEWGL